MTKFDEEISQLSKEGLQRKFDKLFKSYQYQKTYEDMYDQYLRGERPNLSVSNSEENLKKHRKNRIRIEKQLVQIKTIACSKYNIC